MFLHLVNKLKIMKSRKLSSNSNIFIDTTPLSDVAFIILIFLLLCGKLWSNDAYPTIKLPKASNTSICVLEENNLEIRIIISEDQKISFEIVCEKLKEKMDQHYPKDTSNNIFSKRQNFDFKLFKRALDESEKLFGFYPRIFIIGDEMIPSMKIKFVINTLQQYGINRFSILTENEKWIEDN